MSRYSLSVAKCHYYVSFKLLDASGFKLLKRPRTNHVKLIVSVTTVYLHYSKLWATLMPLSRQSVFVAQSALYLDMVATHGDTITFFRADFGSS